MTTRAIIEHGNAYLFSDFGLNMARRFFDPAVIDALPRFVRGKHKGKIKAQIEWRKVAAGGWVSHGEEGRGHVERRVGQIISATLLTSVWQERGEQIAHWERDNV